MSVLIGLCGVPASERTTGKSAGFAHSLVEVVCCLAEFIRWSANSNCSLMFSISDSEFFEIGRREEAVAEEAEPKEALPVEMSGCDRKLLVP